MGLKGKYIDELENKMQIKVKFMLLILEVSTHRLSSGFTFGMFKV